jgi:molecular chaperone Hsp33
MTSNAKVRAHDHVLRAMTDDGAFRVIAARTTDTVQGVLDAQRPADSVGKLLGDLVTGTIFLRETMSPDYRVQGFLTGDDGRSRLIADAHPEGITRGLVQLAKGKTAFPLGARSRLTMMRSLHSGALQQGVVEFGVGGDVSAALMEYMQISEQIVTFVAVSSIVRDGKCEAAGGYLVQLLPETRRDGLAAMTERLAKFTHIDALIRSGEADPDKLLAAVLEGHPFHTVGEEDLRFGCNCSNERVAASLATLPKTDIADLIRSGEVLEIACDYCKVEYKIAPDHLRGLLAEN